MHSDSPGDLAPATRFPVSGTGPLRQKDPFQSTSPGSRPLIAHTDGFCASIDPIAVQELTRWNETVNPLQFFLPGKTADRLTVK